MRNSTKIGVIVIVTALAVSITGYVFMASQTKPNDDTSDKTVKIDMPTAKSASTKQSSVASDQSSSEVKTSSESNKDDSAKDVKTDVGDELSNKILTRVKDNFNKAKEINASSDVNALNEFARSYNYGQTYAVDKFVTSTLYDSRLDDASLKIEKGKNEGNYVVSYSIMGDDKVVYNVKLYYISAYDATQLDSVSTTADTSKFLINYAGRG